MSFSQIKSAILIYFPSKTIYYVLRKCKNHVRRMLLTTSMKKASITIETALALPVFLFAVIQILYMINVFHMYMDTENQLHQSAKKLAIHAHAGKTLWQEENLIFKNEVIELSNCYSVKLPFRLGKRKDISFQNKCKVRAFTGYDNMKGDRGPENDDYVYITETGSVYHQNRGCSHLSLSVSATAHSQIPKLRNQDGAKYKACRRCGSSKNSLVYITNQGNHYHNSILCSGLKRTIEKIPIRQIGNRPPCQRCGYS